MHIVLGIVKSIVIITIAKFFNYNTIFKYVDLIFSEQFLQYMFYLPLKSLLFKFSVSEQDIGHSGYQLNKLNITSLAIFSELLWISFIDHCAFRQGEGLSDHLS